MDLGLRDRVALVTGSSKGLGAASARVLAAEGARLVLVARSDDLLRTVADELRRDHDAEVKTSAHDLTAPDSADAAARAALDAFKRIDILVNCAGSSQGGVFWDIPDEVWEQSLALKFLGTVRMIRAVLPAMRAQKYGRIVTVVGNTGRQPNPRMLPGAAANAALLAVTRGLAEEVAADGIVVNAVNPGPTRTERWTTLMANLAKAGGSTVEEVEAGFMKDIPMQRLAAPEEIARHIVFLASDAAANTTGTSITADGGWTKASA